MYFDENHYVKWKSAFKNIFPTLPNLIFDEKYRKLQKTWSSKLEPATQRLQQQIHCSSRRYWIESSQFDSSSYVSAYRKASLFPSLMASQSGAAWLDSSHKDAVRRRSEVREIDNNSIVEIMTSGSLSSVELVLNFPFILPVVSNREDSLEDILPFWGTNMSGLVLLRLLLSPDSSSDCETLRVF